MKALICINLHFLVQSFLYISATLSLSSDDRSRITCIPCFVFYASRCKYLHHKPLLEKQNWSNIDLGKPKSVASVIYLDVVNNYTVIQHVRQILDDFVVSAVSSQNCAGKCAKSQVIFLQTASRSFFRP